MRQDQNESFHAWGIKALQLVVFKNSTSGEPWELEVGENSFIENILLQGEYNKHCYARQQVAEVVDCNERSISYKPTLVTITRISQRIITYRIIAFKRSSWWCVMNQNRVACIILTAWLVGGKRASHSQNSLHSKSIQKQNPLNRFFFKKRCHFLPFLMKNVIFSFLNCSSLLMGHI